jgi:hypothetical protein
LPMTGPIVFISHFRVKESLLADFEAHYQDSLPFTAANKPGTLVQLAYISEDSEEVVIARLFPDAEAMDRQLQGSDERSKKTFLFIEPTLVEIYGNPSEYTLETMKKVTGAGVKVVISPHYLGGFIRNTPV